MADFVSARRPAAPNSPTTAPPIVHDVLRTPGEPLDEQTGIELGRRLGEDFSHVRVHSDGRAAESAKAVGASAYAVGRDVVFGSGQYAPRTATGRETLAHELAHVVQRGAMAVPSGTAIEVAATDHPLERAARGGGRQTSDHGARPVLLRQTPPGGGGSPGPQAPARRVVYVDAEIIDAQLGRGNQGVANALKGLRASGAELRISRWTYYELVEKPLIPRTAVANRELIKDLGLTVESSFVPQEQRVEVQYQNQVGSTTVVSAEDAQLVAAAKRGGGEIFSTDRAFRNNAASVEKQLGVRIAPEAAGLTPAAGGVAKDYRVARQLMGLAPITISLSGVVNRGPAGGGTPPGTPPPGAAPTGTARATSLTATSAGSGKPATTTQVGTPDMRPVIVGGPSARGTGVVAGVTLAFQGINFALNLVNDYVQAGRAKQALAAIEPTIMRNRAARQDTGTLLVFFYTQAEAPSESLIQPGPVFGYIETATGLTRDEAWLSWQGAPAVRPGYGPGTKQLREEIWIPPTRPAGPAALTTPFRGKVALATFAAGRTILQDVEWGGLTGFDDEGTSRVSVPADTRTRFIVLRVPSPLLWFYQGEHRSVIPVEERPAAEGGSIPVVNLDPSIPGFNVAAACVFPADDDTAALFAGTPPTRDNFGHLRRYPNLDDARWVRPENIRVLQRL